MTLPELSLQAVYSRLAWGAVIAALIVWLAFRARHAGRVQLASAIGLTMGVMWLPGQASPAYWLGLAFQSPSGLLTALCVAALVRQTRGGRVYAAPVLPPFVAGGLAAVGALLYADTVGWVSLGMYAAGFGPLAAPAGAMAIAVAASSLVLSGTRRETGLILLAPAALFVFTRLPTGNVFDAMLDPFLWCWAVWSVLRRLRLRERLRARGWQIRHTPAP